ncbi:hypothetical protein C8Q74DRAFT_1255251 [Fomes fomentarius]|nr:hypothetical protein C8Q74DRAFT_1255251 [Fomes fomentarius]
MLHNQSLLGVSLLVLSCASPTLGAMVDSNPPMVDSASPPSTPALGTNSEFSFKGTNPPASTLFQSLSISHPSQTVSPAVAAASASSPVRAGTNPAVVTTSANGMYSARPSAHRVFHHASAHRAKVHSSIAAHFSSHFKLHGHSPTQATPASEPTSAVLRSPHLVHDQVIPPSRTADSVASSVASVSSSSKSSLLPSSTLHPFSTGTVLENPASSLSAPHHSTTDDVPVPTMHDLDEPNPGAHTPSEATQRARRTAVVAAFLILATLGAVGGGVICFRCGLFPCCSGHQRRLRGPNFTDRTVEEGLRGLQKLGPPKSSEKAFSLVPGKPPISASSFTIPSLARNGHAHTLSCSTCPPDSLNGVRGGVSGTEYRTYAPNDEGDFEDVTHILVSDADADADAFSQTTSTEDDRSSTTSRSPRESSHSAKSTMTHTSGRSSQILRMSTGTAESSSLSVDTRVSRASEGATSTTGESYTTCESRYSTPSIERDARNRPPSTFDPISEESGEDDFHSPLHSSPESSASTASAGSMSLLLMTPPEEPAANYKGLADAALPKAAGTDIMNITPNITGARPVSAGSEDMDMVMEDSDWDVARMYGSPPPIPLPPTPTPAAGSASKTDSKGRGKGKSVKGRPQTGMGLVNVKGAGAVAVNGRACVLMRG